LTKTAVCRLAAAVLTALIASAAGAATVAAHGGFPTRLGVREDPDLALLARLVLVYLVDGEGMNVHLTRFEPGADLGEEYTSGRIDLFLDMPARDRHDRECEAGEPEKHFEGSFPGSWVGLFGFAVGTSPCSRPALVAHNRVAADLRFTLLRDTLGKLLAAVTLADFERLRQEGGEEARDAAAAARRLLKSKGLL
jgi:hypothetical protein